MIQTFPNDFVWDGSKTDTEQMIGNAVPVKLAEYVATALLTYINENSETANKATFYDWLIAEQHLSERSARDVISRCKRADGIVSSAGVPDAYYLFTLEQQPCFQQLSVNVKSQIKRAVRLKGTYLQHLYS